MKTKLLSFILLLFIEIPFAMAKPKLGYLGISANNYVSAMPVSGFTQLFTTKWHPGLTLSTGFNWKDKPKHSFTQNFKFSFFNHRFIQHSFMLYTEFGYKYKLGKKIGLNASLGGGYLHMIPGTDQFRQNDDGTWEKIKIKTRPQAMISLSLGIDYTINKKGTQIFACYQNILQTPFIPGYVPLLPYNVLHLGVNFPMSQILKKGEKNAK